MSTRRLTHIVTKSMGKQNDIQKQSETLPSAETRGCSSDESARTCSNYAGYFGWEDGISLNLTMGYYGC